MRTMIARSSVIPAAMRTPVTTPNEEISSPPSGAPITRGKRTNTDYALKAMTRPSARILVQPVEKIFERREQPDHRATRAERGQILRQVALPEFLAQPQPEDAQRQNRHVAIEAQALARRCLSSCIHSRLLRSSLQNSNASSVTPSTPPPPSARP